MGAIQWARIQAAVDCPLRQGAWYRVTSLTKLEAVVDVEGARVAVPRPFVEIRAAPPQEWTIVRVSAGRGPAHLQSGYVVCPNCRSRAVLPFAWVTKLQCQHCKQVFAIAWTEAYLPKT